MIEAIVVDIEGTTTSISFVYDVLFPFARQNCEAFLRHYWNDHDVQGWVRRIAADAQADADAGLQVHVPAALNVDEIVRSVHSQMDLDRKNGGLKGLQGLIWVEGYQSGEIKGHVYPDVPPALQRWHAQHIPVYIYSSGSVGAQKLLFGHSEAGDLLPMLAGHFDTAIGGKRDAASYAAIAAEIGVEADRIVFATDNVFEAHAAREAGLQTVVLNRPGNPDQGPHDHPVRSDFDAFP